ncbi:hypothetical protein SKAU_G00054070 [Synaphobranchus kaupii]|uniref:Uncharacterized protein n=1 Tax=Synaphobranchus kaupii TaxID=118154 RepID=A0A9Q1G3L1_SYNKA|nr:hypothetical protein SKAU_G00054070 [Synaphobranchus kaupii]
MVFAYAPAVSRHHAVAFCNPRGGGRDPPPTRGVPVGPRALGCSGRAGRIVSPPVTRRPDCTPPSGESEFTVTPFRRESATVEEGADTASAFSACASAGSVTGGVCSLSAPAAKDVTSSIVNPD